MLQRIIREFVRKRIGLILDDARCAKPAKTRLSTAMVGVELEVTVALERFLSVGYIFQRQLVMKPE